MGFPRSNPILLLLHLLLSSLLISFRSPPLLSHAATDTVSLARPLKDGETLISAGEIFQLGFFSPGSSTGRRYVGIWYYNFSTDTVLWVANRENPVTDSSGTLSINTDGNLAVLDGTKTVLWTSNASAAASNDSTAQLTDAGNFILNNSGSVVWQSFDHPTDTYLPGMKVGLDLETNVNQLFTSWKSKDDPAVGRFSMGNDPRRSTQLFVWEGTKPWWRSGLWNGQTFQGIPNMVPTYIYGLKLNNFAMEKKIYFYFTAFNSSHRYILTWDGIEDHLIWKKDRKVWERFWAAPTTECEFYNKCGKFGSCTDGETPICRCLRGFEPVSAGEWSVGNWSSGCRRRTPLECERNGSAAAGEVKGDGFLKVEGVKLPDLSDWAGVASMDACGENCSRNCSCNAYTFVGGIGCLMWGVDLLDIHKFASGGSDMYLRLAGSELAEKKKKLATSIIVVIVLAVVFSIGIIFLTWKCKKRVKECLKWEKTEEKALCRQERSRNGTAIFSRAIDLGEERKDGKGPELPLLDFDSIKAATSSFSPFNLLGGGGFGPVYKGTLPGGQEIAVKRLSSNSGQGVEEFKNEVILIAKLQHRNLVRLVGCCIQGEEKILIYEYMPNTSLDAFLFEKITKLPLPPSSLAPTHPPTTTTPPSPPFFDMNVYVIRLLEGVYFGTSEDVGKDSTKKGLLDWKKRYNIIEGIARGLLYLHRDSRLRIIHRDLKASNILLDEEMNPKISDFGMARIFGQNENQANTMRVVGTYGYMAPEYAMQGLFSVKSDVYSFGVLLLEIASGKRNSTFIDPETSLNLLAYAWHLWSEDRAMELVDPSIGDSGSRSEVLRCVNVALLCVQDRALDRPTIASVVAMLESEDIAQPLPRKPAFTADRTASDTESSTIDIKPCSTEVSITTITGR